MWHLYVVRCSDGTLYTGISTDVGRRVELVWSKEYKNRSEAQSAEYSFKKLLHKQKWDIINEDRNRI